MFSPNKSLRLNPYLKLRPAVCLGALVFTTAVARCQPSVFTQPAAPVTRTNAVLNGMVVPNGLPTTAWFEWGTDTNFGQISVAMDVGAGNTVIKLDEVITNLFSTGYFRVAASNQLGITYGQPQVFTRIAHPLAWGNNSFGQANAPTGNDVVAIGAAKQFVLAVDLDGRVTGWGKPGNQITIPPNLPAAMAVAGGSHSLALTTDGLVVGWGPNGDGQINVPQDLTNVIAIAAGGDHSVALKKDGTVVVWGNNANGQTNVPPDLTNVVAIAYGDSHVLALKIDGSIVAWGLNGNGQTNVPIGLTNAIAVAGGGFHSLALKADGTVVAWGSNSFGQTNVPADLSNVVAIAAGDQHSLALDSGGKAVGWG